VIEPLYKRHPELKATGFGMTELNSVNKQFTGGTQKTFETQVGDKRYRNWRYPDWICRCPGLVI
jgi:hypothetical protein